MLRLPAGSPGYRPPAGVVTLRRSESCKARYRENVAGLATGTKKEKICFGFGLGLTNLEHVRYWRLSKQREGVLHAHNPPWKAAGRSRDFFCSGCTSVRHAGKSFVERVPLGAHEQPVHPESGRQ